MEKETLEISNSETPTAEEPQIIEEIAGAEDTIFGAVYDDKMGDRIKITVIATGFNQNGQAQTRESSDRSRAAGNVIPLAQGESGKSIDYQRASTMENLDQPAFRRYGIE